MNNGRLTARQDRFCREYAIDCNATQAAIRAGYKARTARQQGQRLLTKVHVRTRLAELQKPSCDQRELDAEYVIERLKRNEEEAFNQGRIAESNRALELLGKHLALFTERIDLDSQVTLGPTEIIFNYVKPEAKEEIIDAKDVQKCLPNQPQPPSGA